MLAETSAFAAPAPAIVAPAASAAPRSFFIVRILFSPLFSPRSARLVRAAIERISDKVRPVAMSEQVATAWGTDAPAARVASEPTSAAMLARVLAELRDDSPC